MTVPKLRFPEFRDAGEWEKKKLDDLLDYQQPTAYLVSDTNYSDTYKIPVLTAGKTFILGYTNEQHGIFSEDLPVIIFDDFTTATQFVDFPFKAKSSAMKILQARNGVSIKFMYEAMQIISYEVGTHERHWISKFAPMSILVPRPIEQQKIADCLSSLDDRITAETQKLDTLKAHKKGLMQQLFPAEGETLPKLRFPEFRDAGKWEEKPLVKVCDVNPSNEGLPEIFIYIDLESVVAGKLIYNKKISREDAPSRAQRLLKNGDVIYQIVRPYQRNNFFCDFDDANHYVASTGYAQLRAFDVGKFLYQLIHTDTFVDKVIAKCTGSNYPAINSSDLAEINVSIPLYPEQQKIADCLSSLDDRITAETQKIDTLKTHKKGLMQQLFPALDEVKG
jgi:type I restriction enzyme S subunit